MSQTMCMINLKMNQKILKTIKNWNEINIS